MINYTWSKSCFPVVLGWMANSSSASTVVTRTFTCEGSQRSLLLNENSPSNGILGTTKFQAGCWLPCTTYHFRHLESSFYFHKTLKCKIMESLVDSERFCKSLTKYKRKEVSTNNVTNTPYFSHASKYFPWKKIESAANTRLKLIHGQHINNSVT